MSTEDNSEQVSLTDEISSETTHEEEPIEQVMSQETTESESVPSTEAEDRERFEETAKFEEEIEPKTTGNRRKTNKKVRRPDSILMANLESKLKKYADAGKKTDLTIKDIQRQIRDLDKRTNTKHYQIVRDLQTQVRELQRQIGKIGKSTRSTKSATRIKNVSRSQKKRSKNNIKKKNKKR